MATYDELVAVLKRLLTRYVEKPRYIRGVLGDGTGQVEVPSRADHAYVRYNRSTTTSFEIFNKEAPMVDGWPVLIGEFPWQPGLTQIVGTDWEAYSQAGWGSLVASSNPHAPTHEWPDAAPGSDPVSVYPRSIVPLRAYVLGSGSTTVYVNRHEYEYQFSGQIWGGLPGVDLAPASTGLATGTARLMGVYLEPGSNTLLIVTGSIGVFTDAMDPPLVSFPAGVLPVARVRVYGGQAAINEADIRDARRLFNPMFTGTAGGNSTYRIDQTTVSYNSSFPVTLSTVASGEELLKIYAEVTTIFNDTATGYSLQFGTSVLANRYFSMYEIHLEDTGLLAFEYNESKSPGPLTIQVAKSGFNNNGSQGAVEVYVHVVST